MITYYLGLSTTGIKRHAMYHIPGTWDRYKSKCGANTYLVENFYFDPSHPAACKRCKRIIESNKT